ncbi:MAG: hypothetical protein HYU66_01710 [Armatimonadetes bacterium]|nr:hypothetical protein [Armatimonadota bacterium]
MQEPEGGDTGESGGGRDERIWAAVRAILKGRAKPKDFDTVLEFAHQRGYRVALAKGITSQQDLEAIAAEVSLRFLERVVMEERLRGSGSGPGPPPGGAV